jgi:hypothetical protein
MSCQVPVAIISLSLSIILLNVCIREREREPVIYNTRTNIINCLNSTLIIIISKKIKFLRQKLIYTQAHTVCKYKYCYTLPLKNDK